MKFTVEKEGRPIIKKGLGKLDVFSFDSLWTYHPCVLEWKEKYYLFYTGKRLKKGIAHQIGLAVSFDLLKWNKMVNPILREGKKGEWDSDFAAHAFVFKDKGRFYMLYDGSRKENWLEEIGLAESQDLIHWEKYAGNPIFKVGKNWWERKHVSRCFLFKEKGIYYLYYAGHDGQRERIGMAKGKSIFKLERFEEPVLDVGEKGSFDEKSISDPRIIKYHGGYLMFYSAVDGKGIERMGVAESSDLVTWKKYAKNPLLDVSSNGWDKISAARGDVKLFGKDLYLFYSGRRKHFYNIGMAKLSIK